MSDCAAQSSLKTSQICFNQLILINAWRKTQPTRSRTQAPFPGHSYVHAWKPCLLDFNVVLAEFFNSSWLCKTNRTCVITMSHWNVRPRVSSTWQATNSKNEVDGRSLSRTNRWVRKDNGSNLRIEDTRVWLASKKAVAKPPASRDRNRRQLVAGGGCVPNGTCLIFQRNCARQHKKVWRWL